MPRKSFELSCGCKCWPGATRKSSDSTCEICGEPGRYLGYHLSMSDAMAAFWLSTGLAPMGPERESVEGKAIIARLVTCPCCDGVSGVGSVATGDWLDGR
jgi:hypothetical protein